MDKNYWNEYYKLHGGDKEISDPSSFAKFILKNGRSLEAEPDCMPIKEILEFMPGTK